MNLTRPPENKFGPAASTEDFESDPEIVTSTIYRYEDVDEHQTQMYAVDDITPEVMEIYIGEEIMVSHGDTVEQGSARRRKRNVEGNNIGSANSNPIIDT